MAKSYRIKLAEIELNYRFYISETCQYFKDFIVGETEDEPDMETNDKDMLVWSRKAPYEVNKACLEHQFMLLKLTGYLCRNSVSVIHACALVWKGFAWIFTARSGTGKTTLYRNWKKLFGEEIKILNGDMPLVQAFLGQQLWIYPSPWNGKENYGSMIKAPLGGILYLSQDKENRMERMGIPEAVAPLYTQFMCISDSEMTVKCISLIEERILESVPVWNFKKKGDLESAKVSSREIEKYLREKGQWKNTD